MANKNINQLTAIADVAYGDELIIWDTSTSTTRKVTVGDLGSSGITGLSGTSGSSGVSTGSSGTSGSSGATGSAGTSGTRGTSGSSGNSGNSGSSGISGSSGSSGTSGTSGSSGVTGSSGSSGASTLSNGTRAGAGTDNTGLGSSGDPTAYAQMTFGTTSLVTNSLAAGTYLISTIFEIYTTTDPTIANFRLYQDDGTALGVVRQRQVSTGKDWISWTETVVLSSTAIIQVWAKTDDIIFGNQFAYSTGSSISWVRLA